MQLLNEQFNSIFSEYNETQLRNSRLLLERQKEIHAKIPEIAELDHHISELSLNAVKLALDGCRTGSSSLKHDIETISQKKAVLLSQHGYPDNYLQPVYNCPDCQDTGYIGDEKCHCFRRRIVSYLYEQSNLQDVFKTENFSLFNEEYYPDDYVEESTGMTPRDNIRRIHETALFFSRNFDQTHDNLLLYGNTGVGKTFLTHCIAGEALQHSHTVVYLTSLGLFDILEKNKFDKDLSSVEKSATVSYILDCDLLIIDDLGTELNNGFTSSQLYQVIDTRLIHQRSTIISTNLSFDDLREQYSERIFSRLTSSYTLLKLTGDDIRLKKAITARHS